MSDFAEMLKEQLVAMTLAQQTAYLEGFQAGYRQGVKDATAQAGKVLDEAIAENRKLAS